MTAACNLCEHALGEPIYRSPDDRSITSTGEIRSGCTMVYFCDRCGHLQTTPLADLAGYYDHDYRILIDSEEEDQLYSIERDGRKVFRVEHQVATLLNGLDLPHGAHVLDFGCAKGAMARRLVERRPDVRIHLFDVSNVYEPFWQRFADHSRCATHDVPAEWHGRFDLVMSYFVMEHVADPVASLRQQAALLKPGGALYFIVPNVYTNSADLIVADHVNHFGAASLSTLMELAELRLDDIDDETHRSAWVIKATNADPVPVPRPDMGALRDRVTEMSAFWSSLADRIRVFEAQHNGDAEAAIYGSGFYGTFIASCLTRPNRVRCFLDRNPYRQGKELMDRQIVAPDALDQRINTVYVGLNRTSARQAVESITSWQGRYHEYFYL